MVKISELLPIGSVLLLKEGSKRVMVTGMLQTVRSKENENEVKTYDYVGVLYPEGYIGQDRMFLFDHDAIDKVYFTGYDDFERTRLLARIDEAMNSDGENTDEENAENTAENN